MPSPASVTADQSEEVRRAEMGAAGRQRPDADILDDDYDPEMEYENDDIAELTIDETDE